MRLSVSEIDTMAINLLIAGLIDPDSEGDRS